MADIEQGHVMAVNAADIKGDVQISPVDSFAGKVELTEEERELALALQNYVPGSEAEKKLVRKVDLIMIPTVWCMYILAVLDRSNIVSLTQYRFSKYNWLTRIQGKRQNCGNGY
jgi:hypothetical protein